ncbi:acetolactate synthase, small subunit [Ruminococcus sp. YE71]|uniref:acetolactate synthase small subunit n=1 Tax=unclassified Ruminococcus TaxID=2608920 RepID=UPI000881CD12|nr:MULTISPECIES: acetolactate synthase small subunit [unclassified Ruminococcus]SDA23202.1 acetolactate synthase, small subunit [Ruminococcus sp. YE78]SFW39413.1 acetolactate synthase, small subunit [Ruminococcus sp. YE71]
MKHTISVLVENHSGVLSRISGLFSRRGFNIESLAVGPTHDPAVSRVTIIADGNDYTVEQIEKQLNKLVEVIKVKTFAQGECMARELLLVKIAAGADKRQDIMTICEIADAKVIDLTVNTMTLEVCDKYEHLKRFEELIAPYGIIEMVRTGTIAIQKGAEVIAPKK